MRIYLLILITLCSVKLCYAQEKTGSKLALMQGVWNNTMNTESEKAYTIIKRNQSLNFVYNNKTQELDFPLNESIEGFQNFASEDLDSINISSIKSEGTYYTIVDRRYINDNGWVHAPFFLTPNYFDCDEELMSINGGQLVEYGKIDELPFEALTKLYKRGKLDGRDYIKDYLELKTRQVKPLKCKVYRSPNEQSKVQLKEDYVVIITEETNKWVKVKYSEEGFGWIKKGDIK